ncbi:MAG: hypothetical protein U0271_17960 [Polyangiaceae bacterium]
MRFWPFGKEKSDEDTVDFVSRVVGARAHDGRTVRAKITVHFHTPLTETDAAPHLDRASALVRADFEAAHTANEVLGMETALSASLQQRLVGGPVRSAEVVAIHLVADEAPAAASPPASQRPPPSSVPPKPPSIAPPSRLPSVPPARSPSAPPPRSAAPPPRSPSAPPMRAPSAPGIPRLGTPSPRRSSSQLLAVREAPLIPIGASPEEAGFALKPLLRDAATRVLVGTLRALDLVVLRGIELDESRLDDYVPVSTVAPGRFGDERREELDRWLSKLGASEFTSLRDEAAAIVCHVLMTSLEQAGVAAATNTALLESAARVAFADESPLGRLGSYLGPSATNPAGTLARVALATIGDAPHGVRDPEVVLGRALTPVYASLQEDFALIAGQVRRAVGD